MAGGRVGKDGIHGATFSSIELDETAPATAVQIGSPITQKLAMDFLLLAARRGLLKCSTDNGAGGLSSSVGELAGISGGAVVELERVP
ncbi:AIR synthase-related protein [Hymenobacter humi]